MMISARNEDDIWFKIIYKANKIDLKDYKYRRGTQEVHFSRAQLKNSKKKITRKFSIGDNLSIEFCIKSPKAFQSRKVKLAIQIRASDGTKLCNMVDTDSGFSIEELNRTELFTVELKDIRFYPDSYYISLWAGSINSIDIYDHVIDCLSFDVIDGGLLSSRRLPRSAGILFLTPEWHRISE